MDILLRKSKRVYCHVKLSLICKVALNDGASLAKQEQRGHAVAANKIQHNFTILWRTLHDKTQRIKNHQKVMDHGLSLKFIKKNM